jgi:hypothetical protein
MMGARRAVQVGLMVVALAACSGGDDTDAGPALTVPTIPQDPDLEPGMFAIQGAMGSGVLAVRGGCVGFVSDNGGQFLLIQWPEGTTSTAEEVRYGDHVMRPGDRIRLGGGTGADPRDPRLQECVDATGAEVWVGVATPED